MIRRLAGFFTYFMRHYLPDAYLFAILLTLLTAVLAFLYPLRCHEGHHDVG